MLREKCVKVACANATAREFAGMITFSNLHQPKPASCLRASSRYCCKRASVQARILNGRNMQSIISRLPANREKERDTHEMRRAECMRWIHSCGSDSERHVGVRLSASRIFPIRMLRTVGSSLSAQVSAIFHFSHFAHFIILTPHHTAQALA